MSARRPAAELPAETISCLDAVRLRFLDELPPDERDLVLELEPFDLLGLDGVGIRRAAR